MSFVIQHLLGTKWHCSGDLALPDEKVLLLSNHRSRYKHIYTRLTSRLDGLFTWGYFLREGRVLNEKIVMKQEMKLMAPFGTFSEGLSFLIFLKDGQSKALVPFC
jgi:1-acyl-sn-glycerol-3-phosphate acyltransferase